MNTCIICATLFEPQPVLGAGLMQRYCSLDCQRHYEQMGRFDRIKIRLAEFRRDARRHQWPTPHMHRDGEWLATQLQRIVDLVDEEVLSQLPPALQEALENVEEEKDDAT